MPPTTVPLMRMNWRSRPTCSSMRRDVSSAVPALDGRGDEVADLALVVVDDVARRCARASRRPCACSSASDAEALAELAQARRRRASRSSLVGSSAASSSVVFSEPHSEPIHACTSGWASSSSLSSSALAIISRVGRAAGRRGRATRSSIELADLVVGRRPTSAEEALHAAEDLARRCGRRSARAPTTATPCCEPLAQRARGSRRGTSPSPLSTASSRRWWWPPSTADVDGPAEQRGDVDLAQPALDHAAEGVLHVVGRRGPRARP